MTGLKKTNFVVVACDFEEGQALEELWLLGWDNKTDWFDAEVDSYDILTEKGNVKKNQYGLISVSRNVAAYVGEKAEDCKSYCDDANKEGYNCTVCRIEWVEGEWRVYKA